MSFTEREQIVKVICDYEKKIKFKNDQFRIITPLRISHSDTAQ